MDHMGEFIVNHSWLWLALVLVLVLIYVNELLAQKKRAKEISPQVAVGLINHENAVVIDLRDQDAFRKGHIIDAIRASEEDFNQKKMDSYKNKPLILVCPRGLQSTALATKLKQEGFEQATALSGGITAWQAADLPTVKGK
jgi:rhodanese-related sulfurtransferase